MSHLAIAGGGYAYQRLRSLGCSETAARYCSSKATIRSFDSGESIWNHGQSISHWCTVINGIVTCALIFENKKTTHLALYRENSWFGEDAILSEKLSFGDYRCLVPVDILQIPESCVSEILEKDVVFASRIAKTVSRRVQRNAEMLLILRMGNPTLRSVIGISQFAEAIFESSGGEHIKNSTLDISIPINQTVLASLCGVSRSRLSVIVRALEENGWLRLKYGRIDILNIAAWRDFLLSGRKKSLVNFEPTIEEILHDLSLNLCKFDYK